MIALIAMKLMETGLGPRVAKLASWAIAALLALLALWLAYSWVWDRGRDHERAKWEAAGKATLAIDQKAKDEAAEQRAEDITSIASDERIRNDEIDKAENGKPSDAARRLGCERLRKAGQDTTSIAACR